MTQTATFDTEQPLTAKQDCLVEEYLVDLNATQTPIERGAARIRLPPSGPRTSRNLR
jgi:hypothetical protein